MAQKKMKDIFTHEMGQILFPGQPTVIESKKISPGTDITMKNTRPQIALTPYGATQMSPNQNYSFAGNTVVELPMAQMGAQAGGDDQQAQIMQIIQMYAQIKGVDPNQLIQEIQALPQEEQQKSFELMASEVQNAMAQQQQAAQQEQPGGMPMAGKGGIMDAYPQAQNLEWFYKTAKNGGLLKAQDVGNINLYNRVLSDRKNFMSGPEAAWKADPALVNEDGSLNMCLDCTNVDYSNQQDVIDASRLINEGVSKVPEYSLNDLQTALKKFDLPMPVYNSAKTRENIINQDPSLKKQRAGGGLSIHQLRGVVDSMVKDAVQRYMTGGEAFPQANKYPEEWAGYSGTMYAQGGEAFPQAQTYLPYDRPGETRPNFMFAQGGSKDEFGGQPDLDTIYRMMRSGGLAVNAKKKRGEELSSEEFQQYLSGGSLKEFQGINQSTTGYSGYNNDPRFDYPDDTTANATTNVAAGNTMTNASASAPAVLTANASTAPAGYSWSTGATSTTAVPTIKTADQGAYKGELSANKIVNRNETVSPKGGYSTTIPARPGIPPAMYLNAINTATGGKSSLLGLFGNVASLVGDFASSNQPGSKESIANPYVGLFEQFQNKVPYSVEPAPGTIGPPPTAKKGGRKKSLPKAQFQMPQLSGVDPNIAAQIAQNRGMTQVQGSGMSFNEPLQPMNPITQIPSPQVDMQPIGASAMSQMNLGLQMPGEGPIADEMSIPKASEAYNPDGPMSMAPMRSIGSITPSTPAPQMQPQMSSQDLGPAGLTNRQIRQEDRSNRRELKQDWKDFKQTDEYKNASKQQRKDFWSDPNARFDHAKAARMVGATQGIADFFRTGNQEYMEDQLKKMGVNTSATMGVSQNRDRGDFATNSGKFRPNEYVEAQDSGRSMTDQTSFYNTFNQMYNAKLGGRILDFLEDGGVYDLDEDTIRLIMEAGGSVEFI